MWMEVYLLLILNISICVGLFHLPGKVPQSGIGTGYKHYLWFEIRGATDLSPCTSAEALYLEVQSVVLTFRRSPPRILLFVTANLVAELCDFVLTHNYFTFGDNVYLQISSTAMGTEREVRDLIAVWGEEPVLSELRSSFQNAKTFVKISQVMKDRGHNRDRKQCCVKLKELRQVYQKTREANCCSGSEPQTCHFYDELHAILGGSATTTPGVLFDSFNGDGGNTEAGFGDEEGDDDEVVDSSQQASRETGFPNSQELFLTLDLEPVPPEPTQGCLPDPSGGEGTFAACVSRITGSSPSQRLVKIRRQKKCTHDAMFSELMLSSHTDRAQTNAWRQTMSECRKAQNDWEERWWAEESKWRAEERAEAQGGGSVMRGGRIQC
ncbi:uncharacterized protein [Lepidochelys kempii]|uniref:uncharacterized protein n=1 Tax=Lepidochelys kempii TaxID=8472 RepID=UPI003C6F3EF3